MSLNGGRTLPAALIVLAVVVTLWGSLGTAGVADDGTRLVINQVLSEEFPQLTTYVTVVDAAGRAVAGLTEGDFQLREDGAPVAGFSVNQARDEGLHLILAIDASGSMLGGTALRDAKNAAAIFLGQLGPRDRAALFIFSESAELVADFTDDFESLERKVNDFTVTPLARTALYEVLYKSAELMERLPPGRKVILIFTDGTDTVGGFSLKDGIEKAQGAHTPVFTIGLLGGEFDPAPIRQMADSTGGFYLEAPTSRQLTDQFQIVRELLEQQYVIRHDSAVKPSSRLSELSVAAPAGGPAAIDRMAFLPLPLTPLVQFTSPADGEKVRGTVPLALDVAAREPITAVTFSVDGSEIGTITDRPYHFDWDSAGLPSGVHVLSATAVDATGRSGQTELRVEVLPSLQVELLSPAPGDQVAGITEVRMDIRSARPLRQVKVLVDGAAVADLPAPPYSYRWDTSRLTPGSYVLSVLAEDEGGFSGTAEAQVNVLPALQVDLLSPAPGDQVAGIIEVRTDIRSARPLRQVMLLVDGAAVADLPAPPYSYRWDTSGLDPGSYVLSVLAEDDGGLRQTAEAQVDVLPVMTVAWVHPQATTTLTETVPLIVDAQGRFGVESVEFSVNGQMLGVARQAPYRLDWPTLALEPGDYLLSACANDVMGHQRCDEVRVQLKRPGVGIGVFLTLGVLIIVCAGVLAMVVRSRRGAGVKAQQPQAAMPFSPPPPPPPPLPPPPVSPQEHRPQGSDAYSPSGRTQTQEPVTQQIPRLKDSSRRATVADLPAVGGMTAPSGYLVLRSSAGQDLGTFRLTSKALTVGRSEENHIQVDDGLASRRHAMVRYDAGKKAYVWEDLTPTNPTIINGQEYSGAHILSAGDQITLGEMSLVFNLGEPSA